MWKLGGDLVKVGDLIRIKRKYSQDQYGDLEIWNLYILRDDGVPVKVCGMFPANQIGIFVSSNNGLEHVNTATRICVQVIVNRIIGWVDERLIEVIT